MRNPPGYWSKERCHEEALKFSTRKEFGVQSATAYKKAREQGWLKDVCSHMTRKKSPKGYWTKEKCHKEALKYETRWEFQQGSNNVYTLTWSNGWLDEVCSHMEPIGDNYNRCVYACEFPDKSVYIGLTYSLRDREYRRQRDEKDAVNIRYKETGLSYETKQLTDYIDKKEASSLEGKYLEQYKEDGWSILNRTKTGSLGGVQEIWTKEVCCELAKECKTRREFNQEHRLAYGKARSRGWLDEICSHMPPKKEKSAGYWTYENCKDEANKYPNRGQFQKGSMGAYLKAWKKGWLNDFF